MICRVAGVAPVLRKARGSQLDGMGEPVVIISANNARTTQLFVTRLRREPRRPAAGSDLAHFDRSRVDFDVSVTGIDEESGPAALTEIHAHKDV